MKDLFNDLLKNARLLQKEENNLSFESALQIAVKLQQNQIISDALSFNDGEYKPSSIEAIALQLGAGKQKLFGAKNMVDAISKVAGAIDNLANSVDSQEK